MNFSHSRDNMTAWYNYESAGRIGAFGGGLGAKYVSDSNW